MAVLHIFVLSQLCSGGTLSLLQSGFNNIVPDFTPSKNLLEASITSETQPGKLLAASNPCPLCSIFALSAHLSRSKFPGQGALRGLELAEEPHSSWAEPRKAATWPSLFSAHDCLPPRDCFSLDYENLDLKPLLVSKVFKLGIREL